ncbi:MAG: response regulator, partial [Desulfobacteraceae bacterium]
MTKILIVDDHEPSLLVTEALMKSRGYEVLKAFNGAEALEIARRDHPDIIVSDILMPVMDGFTLCRETKKDPLLFNIPFIFTSAAFVSEEDEKLCLELGGETLLIRTQEADGFVQELQSIVSECLDSSHTVGQHIHLDENFQKKYREALLRKLTDKIAELEHTNMELTRSEARYRLLADNIADVIWTMDNNLNTTYVSPSVRQLSGYTPDDVLSQSIEEKFTGDSISKFKKALDALNLNGAPVILEAEQPCKNGTTKW